MRSIRPAWIPVLVPAIASAADCLGERVAWIFAKGHPLLLRTAPTEPVLHAPDLLAGRLHLDIQATAIRDLLTSYNNTSLSIANSSPHRRDK